MPSTTSFVLVTVGFRLLVNLLLATHELAAGYLIRFCIKHSMSGGKWERFLFVTRREFLEVLLSGILLNLAKY